MIQQTRVFRVLEAAGKRLVCWSLHLVLCLFVMPAGVAAQAPQKYAQNYHEPFKGPLAKAKDLTFLGPDAAACVKFEPEGLRITLPAGKRRQPIGLTTAFGVSGDFEITVGYELLHEPEPADAGDGGGTRISLSVNLNRAGNNEAAIRRKVTTTQGPHILIWRRLDKGAASPPDDVGDKFPVKEKTGRFRLVRQGDELSFYVAEGADKEFTLLKAAPLGADDVKDVQIFAATGSDTAVLDVRFSDLRISAAALPQNLVPPKIEQVEPKIPTKDYAQSYSQSFKSNFAGGAAMPEGWNFASKHSEQCIQFEQAGLRFTLPLGSKKSQSAGIVSDFGVKGDFEITLSFEALKDPEPADVGTGGTRFSLGVTLDTPLLDTPKSEVATFSRSMTSKGFYTWMRNRDHPVPLEAPFPTPATTGRLRLVRSGADLFYLASIGVDQPFTFLKKYPFGTADVKRVVLTSSTGGEKAMLDLRITDFRIRADAVPGAPAVEIAGAQPQNPAAPPEKGGNVRLMIAALLALAIAGVLALGYFLRRRRGAVRPSANTAARTSVSFACPKCAKVIKARSAMAGKKVRCAQCATAVLVPSIQTGETRGDS